MSTGLSDWEKGKSVQSPLLSVDEAMAYLKMARSTFYVHLNQFQIVKFGKRTFITRASADAVIAAHCRAPKN